MRETEGPLVGTIEDAIRYIGQNPRPRQGGQESPSAELLTAGILVTIFHKLKVDGTARNHM